MLTKAERKARILRAADIFRRHGVTQDEVGAVVGASQPQVSRVLQGAQVRATKLSEDIDNGGDGISCVVEPVDEFETERDEKCAGEQEVRQ